MPQHILDYWLSVPLARFLYFSFISFSHIFAHLFISFSICSILIVSGPRSAHFMRVNEHNMPIYALLRARLYFHSYFIIFYFIYHQYLQNSAHFYIFHFIPFISEYALPFMVCSFLFRMRPQFSTDSANTTLTWNAPKCISMDFIYFK